MFGRRQEGVVLRLCDGESSLLGRWGQRPVQGTVTCGKEQKMLLEKS